MTRSRFAPAGDAPRPLPQALSSLPAAGLLLPRESCPLLTMQPDKGDLQSKAPRATTAPLTSRAGQR